MLNDPLLPLCGARASTRAARILVPLLLAITGPAACVRNPHPATVTAPVPPVPPSSFVESTADAKTTRTFDVREGWLKPALFKAATDALSEKFAVDVSDPHAGFLMTTWQASSVHDGVPDLRYRTRVVVRFLGEDWKSAQVKVEANWQRDDEWAIGYDAHLLDEVSDDLRAKIGKK